MSGSVLDFAVIGAQRAGSTHLAARLAGHPELYLPRDEVPYFEDPFFERSPASELERAVSAARPGQMRGIHRPELLHRPECADRFAGANPDGRVLVVLRDPVSRAISAHAWYLQFGLVPFESTELGLRRLISGWTHPRWPRAPEVLGFGFYAAAIERYVNALSDDRVFVTRLEDLHNGGAVPDALRFLGVDDRVSPSAVADRTNEGVYALARLRWLRARHRLAFSWNDESNYTHRPRRWRRPVRGTIAAAVVGVDRLVLRPLFGPGGARISAALLDVLRLYYARELTELEARLGWDLAAWRA